MKPDKIPDGDHKGFNERFINHLRQSREIAKHLLKIGKNETSALISHKVVIKDNKVTLETEIDLLPIRRIYKQGSKLVEDNDLTFEMLEADLN